MHAGICAGGRPTGRSLPQFRSEALWLRELIQPPPPNSLVSYSAPTEAAALERLAGFAGRWEAKYPAIVKLWESAWAEFVLVLAFD